MADLYPVIHAEMTDHAALDRRRRQLRALRDRLWSSWPWRLVPPWPPWLRARVLAWHAVRRLDG